MHDTLFNMQVPKRGAKLDENIPYGAFFDPMALLTLRQNEVSKGVAIEQLHDNVNVARVSKAVVVADDVWVIQVFQNGHFLADVLHDDVVHRLFLLTCLLVLSC